MPIRYVAVKEEASYAPATPVVPDKFFDANSCKADLSQGLVFPKSLRGRSIYEVREGYLEENIGINMDVKPDNGIGWFLKWVLGSCTSVKVGPTVAYTHTFKAADTIRSFALGNNWDTIKEKRIPGCIMKSLDFKVARGPEPLIAEVDAVGQTESLQTVQTATGWSTLAPFKPYQSKVKLASTELLNLVEGFSIKIANKVYDVGDIGVLGSRKLPRIELAERIVTGTINLPLLSGTLDVYQRFLKDAAATAPGEPLVPFKLELLIDTGIVIETTYNYALNFTLPKCVLPSAPVGIQRQDRKTFNVSFQALYDATDTEIKAELTNIDVSYPDAV